MKLFGVQPQKSQYESPDTARAKKSTLAVVLICVCGSQFFSAYIPKAERVTELGGF